MDYVVTTQQYCHYLSQVHFILIAAYGWITSIKYVYRATFRCYLACFVVQYMDVLVIQDEPLEKINIEVHVNLASLYASIMKILNIFTLNV